MKVIIDCDVGVDDAFAIMLASLIENVEILAITITHGNSSLENCYNNTKLVLNKLYENRKMEKQPPVYVGASLPIIGNTHIENPYFGKDGLVGKANTLYKSEIEEISRSFSQNLKQEDHAALKIYNLVNSYPNEITIVCLGPLTNLALAMRLSHDPRIFSSKISKMVIMGGDEPDNNKHIEQNFLIDPIAAKIVIDEYECPIVISTFQFTIRTFHKSVELNNLNKLFEEFSSKSTKCKFMHSIGLILNEDNTIKDYISCDFIAMLVALKEDECQVVYKQYTDCHVDIVNDKGLIKVTDDQILMKKQNIKFAIDMNQEAPFEYLVYCIKKMYESDI